MFDYELELFNLQKLERIKKTFIYSSYKIQKHPCIIVPGNELIAVAAKDHIIFYNKELEQVSKILHQQENIYGLTASPNGQMVAMVGDNKVLVWDTLKF